MISKYNLIEYKDNYPKLSGTLWQFHTNDPKDSIILSESLKSKIKIIWKTPADGNTKKVEIVALLKCLSNFWINLEVPLINCKIRLILTSSKNCVVSSLTGTTEFAMTDTKLYVPVTILSTEDNINLLE